MPTVEYSAVIDSEADRVWSVLKKFGEIHKWHPAIAESGIEDGQPDGLVGGIRRLKLQDGAIVRERLLSVDDQRHTLSYRFEEAPLPLDNYVATVTAAPLTGQAKTFISWRAGFELRAPDPEGQYESLIRDLVVSGHNSLQRFLTETNER
ncbi:SRPBCC family protein [Paraburkholderia sediminicola]|uniref:SRPBCC family protein n=1 Tax=Paraburkholderia sediminicola TaxID=458836 RepID=UPI0038B94D31